MMKAVLDKPTSTRMNVKRILSDFPETRNCDMTLCVTYWKVIDHVEDVEGISFATCFETIKRARQWLNEQGMFLATETDVLKRRRQNSRKK